MTHIASSDRAQQPALPDLRWITVWFRAVVIPASRRADAAMLGSAIVGAVIFGPTAMRPSDLTGLALHDPPVGAVLAVTWLLVFVPTARMIVRPRTAYLDSLPGNPIAARAVSALALVVLQLPWLALWLIGEGWLGALVVATTTLAATGLASVPAPRLRPRFPAWRWPIAALAAVHLRALRRRAGDALVRGAGLSLLAGGAAGLLVRNNHLSGEPAGVLAASVIAIALLPAQLGPALVTLGAHRDTAWLAAATGISSPTRIAALVAAVAWVHVTAAAIAAITALVVAGANPWLPALAIATALGTSLAGARIVIASEASPTAPMRVVIGALISAALAVICLAAFDAAGAVALIAIALAALIRVRE